MRTYSEIHSELETLYYNFYNDRRKINLEILEFVYDKLQKNFKAYGFDYIKINVNTDYDDGDSSTFDISINGYPYEALNNDEELNYELEMEKLMVYVVRGRLDDVDHEFAVTNKTDFISFQHAYGY
jgi:hypothetical protein